MNIAETYTRRSPAISRITEQKAWTFEIVSLLKTWIERSRNRHEYEKLLRQSDKIHIDVGVTKIQLLREINKPFWRR